LTIYSEIIRLILLGQNKKESGCTRYWTACLLCKPPRRQPQQSLDTRAIATSLSPSLLEWASVLFRSARKGAYGTSVTEAHSFSVGGNPQGPLYISLSRDLVSSFLDQLNHKTTPSPSHLVKYTYTQTLIHSHSLQTTFTTTPATFDIMSRRFGRQDARNEVLDLERYDADDMLVSSISTNHCPLFDHH
jgi:hypothetical protein